MPPAGDDDGSDRAAILRRRAVFVVSAMAGIGLTHCSDPKPRSCLKQTPTYDVPPDVCLNIAVPTPCLEMAPEPPDAGMPDDAGSPPTGGPTDAGTPTDAGANPTDAGPPPKDAGPPPTDAGGRDAGTPRPPRPGPCLRMKPPTDE